MRVAFLAADLEEFERAGIDSGDALARGLAALAGPPAPDRPAEPPGTEAGVRELVHVYAEALAHLRALRFGYVTRSVEYERSRRRYDLVESATADLRREVAPRLRARLRELREHERELEDRLAERGIDPDPIGPCVPEGLAIDPTPRPGEGPVARRTLPPLRPRRRLLRRVLDSLALGRRHAGPVETSPADRTRA